MESSLKSFISFENKTDPPPYLTLNISLKVKNSNPTTKTTAFKADSTVYKSKTLNPPLNIYSAIISKLKIIICKITRLHSKIWDLAQLNIN